MGLTNMELLPWSLTAGAVSRVSMGFTDMELLWTVGL